MLPFLLDTMVDYEFFLPALFHLFVADPLLSLFDH